MRASAWGNRRPLGNPLQLVAVLALIAAVAMGAGLLQPRDTLSGNAEVIDGDTLRIGSTRIRLTGIDAPELDQTCTDRDGQTWACGVEARKFVTGLVAGGRETCIAEGRDRYGRTLATCRTGDTDLGAAIVGAGWAVGEADYLFAQVSARAASRGIWAGGFEQPADWRRDHGNEPNLWDWLRSWFG